MLTQNGQTNSAMTFESLAVLLQDPDLQHPAHFLGQKHVMSICCQKILFL